jgi:Flp pilus assembly protein TadB
MKASDADRDAVLAALSEHFQAGRLTQDELEDRTGRALAARTHGELDALMADLPGWRRPAAPPTQAVPLQPASGRPDLWRMRPLVPAVAVLAAAVIVATVLSLGVHHAGVWLVVVVPLLLVRKLMRGDRSLPRSRRF